MFDSLSNKFDKLKKAFTSFVYNNSSCEIFHMVGHTSIDCQARMPPELEEQVENEVATLNFYDQPHQEKFDPYMNNYNLGLVEGFVTKKDQINKSITLTTTVEYGVIHNEMLETQIAQLTTSLNSALGKFLGQPKTDPTNILDDLVSNQESEGEKEVKIYMETPPMVEKEKDANVVEKRKVSPMAIPKAYQHLIPFPQRLARTKLDKHFDALQQMPIYAKFLKDILANKRKLGEHEIITHIQTKLPPKLRDPGSFPILFLIGHKWFDKALCDLRASVSLTPLTIYKKFGIEELQPTNMSLQLANQSIKHLVGIIENVLVKVEDVFILCNFMVFKIKEDANIPIILGRSFLATADVNISVKKGKLSLTLIISILLRIMFVVDSLNQMVKHGTVKCFVKDPLDLYFIREQFAKHPTKESSIEACTLRLEPYIPPYRHRIENLGCLSKEGGKKKKPHHHHTFIEATSKLPYPPLRRPIPSFSVSLFLFLLTFGFYIGDNLPFMLVCVCVFNCDDHDLVFVGVDAKTIPRIEVFKHPNDVDLPER
ncbi:hypothetical protein CR513_34289, partial [Mucuna pruriens]